MKVIYPAVIKKVNENYHIDVVDLPGCRLYTKTLEEAISKITDSACKMLIDLYAKGKGIPKSTPQNKLKLKANEFTTLIICDLDVYDEKHSEKVIRKNISIPAYLNTYGESMNINFSQLLKEALVNYSKDNCGVKRRTR